MKTTRLPEITSIICLMLLLPASNRAEQIEKCIADSGKAIATIVIPATPTPVEKTAADELKLHLDKITGAKFKIVTETASKDKPRLLVGNTAAARELVPDFDPKTATYDSIILKTVGNDLILAGHPRRGSLYAVYTFLEDAVGVRWWTSEETFIPRKPTLPLPMLNVRYAPKLRFRESYYLDSFNALFKTRLKGNFSSRTRYMLEPMEMISEEYGGNHRLIHFKGRNSAYHSFYELIPPAKYFKDHPEWFSEIKGERTHKEAQLCLTNEEMRKELVRNALTLLRDDPTADIIQVSQNDSHGRCECKDCLAIETEEGGIGTASGPLLRFVNRVAEDIEKEFPNVYVDTFAYLYTRKAPAKTRPRHNVLIRLCDIECSFLHPLEGSKENTAFVKDLEAWSRIAGGNVFAWDYVTNFSSYMLPHPNLRVLGRNIRTFVKYGAAGLFEQGDALCNAGDFVRLRHWVISHLLWNPDLDEDKLTDEFLTGYYGEQTGKALKQYLTFIHDRAEAVNPFLGCYQQNVTRWLDADDIIKATRLMNDALTSAQEEEKRDQERNKGLIDKVIREKLSLDHVWLLNFHTLHRQAKLEGLSLAVPDNYLEACRIWIKACDRFKVKAYCETNTEKTFKDYRKSLLQQAEHAAEPASIPDICKNLPDTAWMDWQEFEFNKRPEKQVTLVRDEAASNKVAARMPGDHNIWAVQFPLLRFPNAAGTTNLQQNTCRVCAFVRCEASVKTGPAMALGIYDFKNRKMVTSKSIPVSEIEGSTYKIIDLGLVEISKGLSFWASPPKRPGEVKAVFVDRVVVIKE